MKYKTRFILYIILLVIVLFIMYMIRTQILVPSYTPRDIPEIKQDTLRIVTDYTPINYYISDDTISGFDYELSQLIAKRSGLHVKVYPEVSLSKSIEGLEKNRYDIIGRPIPVTTDSKENFLFTDPILLNKQVLVQRKAEYNNGKDPIRNQLDLAQKHLNIISDAPTRLRIMNLAHEIGDTIYVNEENTYGDEQLIIMVAKGEIDFAVCDETIAREMSKHYPEIDFSTDISFTQFRSWALRLTSPLLLDSLNIWLKDIKKSPEFQKLKTKYYKKKR